MSPPLVNLTGVAVPYNTSFINSLNQTQQDYIFDNCNTTVCELSYAHVHYDPTLAGNAIYLLIFALVLVVQIVLGTWKKTWGYLFTMIPGLLLEIAGYYARIGMSKNPWEKMPFLIYIVSLTIAPVFFTAALYVSFMRCIPLYDPSLSFNRMRPRNYLIVFAASDVLSLILQSAGGAIADTSNTQNSQDLGIDIMIAGLAFQVLSLGIFIVLTADFTHRIKTMQPAHRRASITNTWKMKGFVYSIAIASFLILIRSIFRCVELSGGFSGPIANNEPSFMILEGGMMSIALIVMTSFHPGLTMGQAWFGKGNDGQGDRKMGDHARIISTDGVAYEGAYGGGIPGSQNSSSYELNVKQPQYQAYGQGPL